MAEIRDQLIREIIVLVNVLDEFIQAGGYDQLSSERLACLPISGIRGLAMGEHRHSLPIARLSDEQLRELRLRDLSPEQLAEFPLHKARPGQVANIPLWMFGNLEAEQIRSLHPHGMFGVFQEMLSNSTRRLVAYEDLDPIDDDQLRAMIEALRPLVNAYKAIKD